MPSASRRDCAACRRPWSRPASGFAARKANHRPQEGEETLSVGGGGRCQHGRKRADENRRTRSLCTALVPLGERGSRSTDIMMASDLSLHPEGSALLKQVLSLVYSYPGSEPTNWPVLRTRMEEARRHLEIFLNSLPAFGTFDHRHFAGLAFPAGCVPPSRATNRSALPARVVGTDLKCLSHLVSSNLRSFSA